MHFAEYLLKFVVWEESFQDAFDDDVNQPSVETLILKHVEDTHDPLPCGL